MAQAFTNVSQSTAASSCNNTWKEMMVVHLQAAVFSIHTQSSFCRMRLVGGSLPERNSGSFNPSKSAGLQYTTTIKESPKNQSQMLKPQISKSIPPMVKPSETRFGEVSQNVNEKTGPGWARCLERPCSFAQRLRAWCKS